MIVILLRRKKNKVDYFGAFENPLVWNIKTPLYLIAFSCRISTIKSNKLVFYRLFAQDTTIV